MRDGSPGGTPAPTEANAWAVTLACARVHAITTSLSSGVLRIEQLAAAALLLVLVVSACVVVRRVASERVFSQNAGIVRATLALALAVLALRLALFPPSFVHANLHGPTIVDDILGAPAVAGGRGRGFGQTTFLVLGLVARLAGRTFETVARTNAVCGVASLVVAGLLAARWSGRAVCLPLALAVGALQPALARIACSEDAHVMAGFFGLLALLAADRYGERRDRAALVLAVASTCLMLDSRQTFYPWAFFVPAVILARGGRAVARQPEALAAFAVIAGAMTLRLLETGASEPAQVLILPAALGSVRSLGALLVHHPLLDVRRYALGSLPLEVLGIVTARRWLGWRVYAVLLAATFLFTLPFGFPAVGVECSFRTPALLLAVVAAAWGAERLWRGGPYLRAAFLALAVVGPVVLPSWSALREPTPITLEYLFVRDVARPALGARFEIAELAPRDPMPSYRLARFEIDAPRVDVYALPQADLARGQVYFLRGLQCRARSGLELTGVTSKVETLPFSQLRDMAVPAFEHTRPAGASSSEQRPECTRILAGAEPVGPALTIDAGSDENPFVFYGDDSVQVQFYRLRPPPG